MSSTAHSIDFQSVVRQLPTATRRKNFTNTVYRILGRAAYNGYDANGYFPVPFQVLQGCDSNYHRNLPYLEQLFDINHSYCNDPYYGYCKQFKYKEKVTATTFNFTDTEPNEKAISYDYEPQTVAYGLEAQRLLTIATSEKPRSRAVKTPFQANHYIRLFINQTITPQYVAKRINLDRENCTYTVKNELITVTGEYRETLLEDVLSERVRFAQISAGWLLNEIRQGHFFCSVSPTNGRENTSFAALTSAFMGFLRFDGEPLEGLDFCNSQFLFFAVLLKNCQKEGKMFKFLKSQGYWGEIVGKKPNKFTLGELIEKLQQIVNKAKLGDDFNAFIAQCEGGTVYDDFAKAAKIERQQAKAAFFHFLFGTGKQTEHSKLFAKTYPSIVKIVAKFKEVGNKKQKNFFKNFSIMLQKIESLYFVKTLRPACIAAGITVLTKHDSIYCKKSQFGQLERLFMDLFRKYFNDDFTTDIMKKRLEKANVK